MRKIAIASISILVAGFVAAYFYLQPEPLDTTYLLAAKEQYDVRILRDKWGVPHIFGQTDADVAYGLAFAHAEDDFPTIQGVLLAARGQLAEVYGRDAAPNDFMVRLLRIWDVIDAKYESELSAETRAICEAYADGLNVYAGLHPEEAIAALYPVRGKDLVAGFLHKIPLFFEMDRYLGEIFAKVRQRPLSQKNAGATMADKAALTAPERAPIARIDALPGGEFDGTPSLFLRQNDAGGERVYTHGSNTFAVAPGRSADGKTRLAINSHQPWQGPVAWYEVHLKSEQGWDAVGGLFPGSPVILHGHNRALGWSHTVNTPDLLDVYVLDTNPDDPDQYRFDGEWLDLDVRTVPIRVKLFGPFYWTFERETLWSVHGPVVRRPHGTYAIRYAGYGRIGQIEQWYRMNKARDFDEWLAAMQLQQVPMFNTGYADRDGNIFYLYNGLLPERAAAYDWRNYLPGETSETLWRSYLPFQDLPQVKNPPSGLVFNCNSTPFQATDGPGNPDSTRFAPQFGIETDMTNRAMRAMELYGTDESITSEEFYRYKFDLQYSQKSKMATILKRLFAIDPGDDSVLTNALDVLKKWDLRTDAGSPAAALAIIAFRPYLSGHLDTLQTQTLVQRLKGAAEQLTGKFNRIEMPWGEVNRLMRGKFDAPLDGGPDIMRAIYSSPQEDGRLRATAGDSYILMVEWDQAGQVHSESIHQFGSATLESDSPHFADQAPLFAKMQFKPVLLDEAAIRAELEREYRPGE